MEKEAKKNHKQQIVMLHQNELALEIIIPGIDKLVV